MEAGMALVATGDLIGEAAAAGTAVGAFNVITLEHAEAILDGAAAAGTPVILQISQNAVKFHRGRLRPLALAAAALAERRPVPRCTWTTSRTRSCCARPAKLVSPRPCSTPGRCRTSRTSS
jgi:hypothetical protein